MADDAAARRSGRKRERNRRYKDDIVEAVELAEELEISDEGDATPLGILLGEDSSDDEEFYFDQTVDEPELSADEELSGAEASDDSRIATASESEADELMYDDLSEIEDAPKRRWKPKPIPTRHFRGISDRGVEASHTSEHVFVERIIGTAKEDQTSYAHARDTWANNITLPYKRLDSQGSRGMSHPYEHTAEQREMEATVGWDWYYLEGGKTLFQARQTSAELSAEQGAQYVAKSTGSSHAVLMGPYGKQKLFSVPFSQSLNLNDAWSEARAGRPTDGDPTQMQKMSAKRQDGWVLNVGSSVQCLAWAPNQLETQYLAISALPSKEFSRPQKSESAPAYTPLPGPSSIQIWAVTGSTVSGAMISQPPELRLIICTLWGYPRQLKWCPMPRTAREEANQDHVSLGLLAGIWTDGHVRVLDVYLDKRGHAGTQYVKYDSSAFESKPVDAMCTCVDWLSPTDVAVGCSNGNVALWNMYPSQMHGNPSRPTSDLPESTYFESESSKPGTAGSGIEGIKPAPYFYAPFHSTYILAICSAYPTHPHLITTSSSTGYLRLTDIRSPYSDHVISQRAHWSPTTICYCAALSCFVSYEEGGAVKMYPIRRFWSSVSIAKREPEALTVAVGYLHPTVLAGFADGALVAVNPVRCFVNKRTRAILQQKVWQHEWARQKAKSTVQPSDKADEHAKSSRLGDKFSEPNNKAQDSQSQGPKEPQNGYQSSHHPSSISRFTEGYRTELPILQSLKPDIGRQKTRVATHAIYTTIYDEETGVRQAAWNPNEGWAGWAASGMGSGLVRIEDLAL